MTILVTGGAGFIGANFVLEWLNDSPERVVVLDKLTYAGNMHSLEPVLDDGNFEFVHGDICDGDAVRSALETYSPRAILHFAAESHVDRSIHGPAQFVQTNVVGTQTLLEESRLLWQVMGEAAGKQFRFLHVSTDEVYGSLGPDDAAFSESTPYAPNSPYAASKAASDHLVRAYFHTYGLPVITSNCSNNYGPYQFPEKLIPLMINNCLRGEPLPVYGDGLNVRDWLYVGDHCKALRTILEHGKTGETYNVGGRNEVRNIDVVKTLCEIVDELRPRPDVAASETLITYVDDRPGHDRRYAIDASKIESELGWSPSESFATGLRKTVEWYLQNAGWIETVTSGTYRDWIDTNYGNRESLS